jgi:eukaryotic-like serine/threonine-protein kinase
MLDQVAALASRHQLAEDVRREIEELMQRALQSSNDAEAVLPRLPTLPSPTPFGDQAGSASTTLFTHLDGPEPADLHGQDNRYQDLGPLGMGGMGEVRRVLDRDLNRTLAMKTIMPSLIHDDALLGRFIEEARATAQLDHPGVVPVYEVGRLADGRVYFTMQEVRGRQMGEAIDLAHRGPHAPAGQVRRLVSTLLQVCRTVAYAHSKGVLHRDLKPSNVMLGAFGEAFVVDWGLVKHLRTPSASRTPDSSPNPTGGATRLGTVAGTIGFMPPEQEMGDVDRIDARADVYGLGAILFVLLTGRTPPSSLGTAEPTWPKPAPGGLAIPDELAQLCATAMHPDPAARTQTASALADDIEAWLDGAKRRERALAIVAQADAQLEEATELRQRAEQDQVAADALLAAVPAWASEEQKAAGWQREDEARTLAQRATRAQTAYGEALRAAVAAAPEVPEAHARLAELYRSRHQAAERRRDQDEAERWHALVARHDRAGQHADYLAGHGTLSLVTEPPGAEAILHRYVPTHRRLVARAEGSLGRTPLVDVPLPMGSYLVVLRHPDRAEVRYPVSIGRGERWDGVRPTERGPHPIRLPSTSDLPAGTSYVPAGWFQAGSAGVLGAIPPCQLWCDAFAIHTFPVTNNDYIAFLDDLVHRGREDEALRCAPRERGGTAGEWGPIIYGRTTSDGFCIKEDADGDAWLPDWPVLMVDWFGATAYAAWKSEVTGRRWRLPSDFEWEKAGRGVDGRAAPWGDCIDPSYACFRESHRGRRLPQSIHSFPIDCSPYGVRGMGGNTRDWCLDTYKRYPDVRPGAVVRIPKGADDALGNRIYRGGIWHGAEGLVQVAARDGIAPTYRFGYLGFRLALDP